MTQQGICKFCHKETTLINSHIIPRHFYLDYKKDKYRSIDSNTGKWKQAQCGVYDDTILCSECDNKIFGQFDNYGYKLLLKDVYNNILLEDKVRGNILYKVEAPLYNNDLFRKFIISILWKASISGLEDFVSIQLGKYEELSLQFLKGQYIADNFFNFFIFKLPKDKICSKVVYIKRFRFANIISYEINMATYQIVVIPNFSKLPMNIKQLYRLLVANPNEIYVLESSEIYDDKVKYLLNCASKWKR